MASTVMKPSAIAAKEREAQTGFDALKKSGAVAAKGSQDKAGAALGYGEVGTGKTFCLVEAILRGKNVFVMSTDFGRNGLRSVKEELQRLGKIELYDKHVRSWDVNDYILVISHLISDYFEKQFAPWVPDIDVWDGFTTFQGINVDEYVLRMESKEMKNNDLRDAALSAGQQDWGAIKKATTRPLSTWIAKIWGGRKVHKYMTCLEQEKEEEAAFGKVTKIRPYLQGQAANLISTPFDVVFRTTREKRKGGGVDYCYTLNDDTGRVVTKYRGNNLNGHGPADPKALWDYLLAFDQELDKEGEK